MDDDKAEWVAEWECPLCEAWNPLPPIMCAGCGAEIGVVDVPNDMPPKLAS